MVTNTLPLQMMKHFTGSLFGVDSTYIETVNLIGQLAGF